ncbi:NUDIX domain-containing protein [Streptomyces sp. NPDC057743]|uniref:NUDIX domain-containing protein n=1 Tax=Streptomyces sp. NPDC057743 TaxID=3346236 RepID=UPI0036C06617
MSALVVGALIVDARDRVFLQQRAADRKLFPGCWDVVGGHVEAYESPLAALQREIAEETGWRLARVLHRVAEGTWEADGGIRTEVDYVVEVGGDLSAPRLERDKHPRYAWFGPADRPLLDESVRRSGSAFIRDAVTAAHAWLARTPAHHRKDISDSL